MICLLCIVKRASHGSDAVVRSGPWLVCIVFWVRQARMCALGVVFRRRCLRSLRWLR